MHLQVLVIMIVLVVLSNEQIAHIAVGASDQQSWQTCRSYAAKQETTARGPTTLDVGSDLSEGSMRAEAISRKCVMRPR